MNFIYRLGAFFWPVSKKIQTNNNGKVSVTYYKGNKYLDTKNANYSFGLLHEVMQFTLDKLEVKQNDHILLLGLGAGSVPKLLQDNYQFNGQLTAVEIDAKIIEIAQSEFNISQYTFLKIQQANAFKFVKNHKQKYHLIIIDLFIDVIVPQQAYKNDFWMDLRKLLLPKAKIAFNVGIDISTTEYQSFYTELEKYFNLKVYQKVGFFNTILIAENKEI